MHLKARADTTHPEAKGNPTHEINDANGDRTRALTHKHIVQIIHRVAQTSIA